MPLRSVAQLVRPIGRAVPWRPPLGAAALAVVIVGWAVHRGSSGALLTPALRNALLFLALGSALALDDAAAATVAAAPISMRWRRALRLGLAMAAAAAGWVACLGVALGAGGPLPVVRLTLEGLAIVAAVHALGVVVGPALGTPVIAALVTVGPSVPGVAERWEQTMGRLGGGARPSLVLLAAGLAVVALQSRDPARPRARPLLAPRCRSWH